MPELEGIKIVFETQSPFADWMIKEDGSVLLREQTITRFQNRFSIRRHYITCDNWKRRTPNVG